MENLNAEQIIKALRGHIGVVDMRCEECPYNQDNGSEICINLLITDALALINSQEQRIKELEQCWEHEHASAMEIFGQWSEKCERLTEENERLRENSKQIVTDAVRSVSRLTEENEKLRNRITCQVVIPNEKLEEIKTECLSRVELDVKAVQADTLEEYRKRVYRKMEKYTAFGREYIQRIMREVTKEMLEGGNNNE